MRLLEVQALRVLLEHRDVVREDAVGVGLRAVRDSVSDHGVQRVAPAHRLLHQAPAFELLQRLVDSGGGEVGIEIAALAVEDRAVGEDEQLRAFLDRLDGLLLDTGDRALSRLGLEQRDVDRSVAAAELLPQVLEQPRVVLARDPAQDVVGERRNLVVPAEDDRERGLDGLGVGRGVAQRRAAPEERARREVLDLALAGYPTFGRDGRTAAVELLRLSSPEFRARNANRLLELLRSEPSLNDESASLIGVLSTVDAVPVREQVLAFLGKAPAARASDVVREFLARQPKANVMAALRSE